MRPDSDKRATPGRLRARRSLAIALGLVVMVVMIFLVTVVRLQDGVLQERPL